MDTSNAQWRKSKRSAGNGNCVEVAFVADMVLVRDSKFSKENILTFMPSEWDAFIGGVKDGEFAS